MEQPDACPPDEEDFAGLNSQDREHLVFAIEASLQINQRFQFYRWAQGVLQDLIPHEILLCVQGDLGRLRFRYEIFSRDLLGASTEQRIGDPMDGLLPRLVDAWLHGGRQPCLLHPGQDGDEDRQRLLAELQRCGFGQVAAHGAREMPGESGSFFVFMRAQNQPSARDAYLLELLMPYLHMALLRMLSDASGAGVVRVSTEKLLSKRQLQVLQWVKNGKTNEEIGLILDISPFTVKNHMQKILRKLGVSNRAQAVGKGAASRLFSAGDAALTEEPGSDL